MTKMKSTLHSLRKLNGISRILGCIAILHCFYSITLFAALARWVLPNRTIIVIPDLGVEIALVAMGIMLLIAPSLLKISFSGDTRQSPSFIAFRRLRLLTALTLICRPLFLHWPTLSTNLLYYGAPAAIAWAITTFNGNQKPPRLSTRQHTTIVALLIMTLGTLSLSLLGIHFTEKVGEHSGDEGHYLTQAESLYHDHNLDIKNYFDTSVSRNRVHVSPASRNGKWYSWHTPGLSFLLAPTVPVGIVARHLVLGLISGIGLAGIYLLAVLLGSSSRNAYTIVAMFGASAYWAIYSARALPEVLGATLAVFAMLAVVIQYRALWRSAFLSITCVSLLPWAHTRFIPLALTLVGCYGLQGLTRKASWTKRVIHLGIYTAGAILGLAAFQLFQLDRFTGGSAYPVEKLLFSLPMGLWHSLAGARGVLASFPLFAAISAATFAILFKHAQPKKLTAFALLCFLSVFLTSCATRWHTGGSCLPGRFLLVVVPLLLPSLILILPTASTGFRFLTWYFGIFSISMLAIEITVLEKMGKAFSDPYMIDAVHPMFTNIARLFYNPYTETRLFPAIVFFATCGILLVPRIKPSLQLGVLIIALTITWGTVNSNEHVSPVMEPQSVSIQLETLDSDNVHFVVLQDAIPPASLFSLSNRFKGVDIDLAKRVTTQDLGSVLYNGNISIPQFPPNDWNNRGFRWATLACFRAGKGPKALRVEAELSGDASAVFAVREGGHTHAERRYPPQSKICDTITFAGKGSRDLSLLVRLEGTPGTCTIKKIEYSSYTKDLLKKANLYIP